MFKKEFTENDDFPNTEGLKRLYLDENCKEKYGFTEFSLENLYINGLISRTDKVKVLATGELKAKLTFKVNGISEKAKGAIEAAGGTVEIVK